MFVAIICSLATLPTVYAATPSNQEKTLSFILNVLPFDMTKYTVTLNNHIQEAPSEWDSYTRDTFDYTLKTEGSILIVSCTFKDNVFTSGQIISQTGPIIQDTPNKNLVNTVKNILENYQMFTGEKLSDMLNALSKVDKPANMITTSGDVKLQISVRQFGSTVQTMFEWTITINNVDYTTLSIGFRNDDFYIFFDNRGLFEIGDTAVNITEAQAVDLALKYLDTYSYQGVAGPVSGFSVVTERISCNLTTYTSEKSPSVLYPCYTVQLPLNGDYGSIWAILVYVWAGSGEAFLGKPLGVGGIVSDQSTTPQSPIDLQEDNSTTTQFSAGSQEDSLKPMNIKVVIALFAIVTTL